MDLEKIIKASAGAFILILKGAAVGAGAILPGVSGGVLCAAFGIYEPMMELLSHPVKSFRRYARMFTPFLIGWVIGFFMLAGAVTAFFEASSGIAMALFSGLIAGTLPGLMKKAEMNGSKTGWSAFFIPMAAVYALLSFLDGGAVKAVSPCIPWYIFCGAVWGLSLVIPGLSSSSILIFMGLYTPMTQGIANFDTGVIIPLLAGLLITVLLSARAVNHLFKTRYTLMSRIILGVIIPPTLMIIPVSFDSVLNAVICIVCFAAGYAAAWKMDSMENIKKP